jgi:GntR family transcriptional regulator
LDALTGRLNLDFRADDPIYLQIVRQIKTLVMDGTLQPGDKLPTVRQMAIDLRINFSTVARAYRILDEQRLISTQRGRGTYIWDEIDKVDLQQQSNDSKAIEKLTALTQRYIREAEETGASAEQIKQALQQQLEKRKNKQ